MSAPAGLRRRAPGALLKRIVLGRALATEEAGHQLLPRSLALPVFASDALSSNAYATEEILHVLVLAGSGALSLSLPIAGAVALLLVVVISSYRQTVRAYPRGGGSYIVSRENLGTTAGLVAAGALLTDYVLTVAVSISAGSFAVASLIPSLLEHRVALSLGFIVLVTLLNLRGAKESGVLFAVPTYAFIASITIMIGTGMLRCLADACPQADAHTELHGATQGLTLFLVLRAFASGATALTGVEAIADGVMAFRGRRPADQARNAADTLRWLGIVSVTMFVGITVLARQMHVAPSGERSVVAQIADATFGGGPGFFAVQIATALILVLAANTAYADFPRLSSILARDRFLPRQFINRGDRLVFSNGIVVLAGLAALLVVLYDAHVTRLIQLYVVGVFTSFTLSQAGMVVRWKRQGGPSWRRSAALNAIGALTTGTVLAVVAVTKFTRGAWIVIAAIPVLVLMFRAIHRHYASVATQLRVAAERPEPVTATRALVLVAQVDEATLRAVGYARAIRPSSVRALHVGARAPADAVRADWARSKVPIPLEVVDDDPASLLGRVRAVVRRDAEPGTFTTVVVPEVVAGSRLGYLVARRRTQLLKASLLFEPSVAVCDVPLPAHGPVPLEAVGAIAPTRTVALVLVSAVHNATLRALEYARAISPTDLRAVTFNVEPADTARVIADWGRAGDDVELVAADSPFREVVRPLRAMIRDIRREAPDTVVSVILPEFVVRRWWHQFLHNQTALAIKASLLFEEGVVLTSVPYHLG